MPFLSTKDLATEDVKKLARALLHPQPAISFTKVGDEQTLALECPAAIFKGALLTYRQNHTPLSVQNIDAPPRK
jgi:hypothetical protein